MVLTFVLIYVVLMALLGASLGIGHYYTGPGKPYLALLIPALQSFLIVWFFMHVRRGNGVLRLFAFGALFWLLILFGLSLSDYLTRLPS